MLVKILAFSRCAEVFGAPVLPWELEENSTADQLLTQLSMKHPRVKDLSIVVAINQEVATGATLIRPGDEGALLPPVSGG